MRRRFYFCAAAAAAVAIIGSIVIGSACTPFASSEALLQEDASTRDVVTSDANAVADARDASQRPDGCFALDGGRDVCRACTTTWCCVTAGLSCIPAHGACDGLRLQCLNRDDCLADGPGVVCCLSEATVDAPGTCPRTITTHQGLLSTGACVLAASCGPHLQLCDKDTECDSQHCTHALVSDGFDANLGVCED